MWNHIHVNHINLTIFVYFQVLSIGSRTVWVLCSTERFGGLLTYYWGWGCTRNFTSQHPREYGHGTRAICTHFSFSHLYPLQSAMAIRWSRLPHLLNMTLFYEGCSELVYGSFDTLGSGAYLHLDCEVLFINFHQLICDDNFIDSVNSLILNYIDRPEVPVFTQILLDETLEACNTSKINVANLCQVK